MNTLTFFIIGYALFLGAMFLYMRRLEKKQSEIKKLIKQLHQQDQ